MGLHLHLYHLSDEPKLVTVAENWDPVRRRGDAEFDLAMSQLGEDIREDPISPQYDLVYWRPSNLDAAALWVKDTYAVGSSMDRMLSLIERLREDQTLWVYTSR